MPLPPSPRLLAESLEPVGEPLNLLVAIGPEVPPSTACRAAARALLDLPARAPAAPAWLAPHQVPAHARLLAILDRFGGAVLADAVGLGKSYVALGVAHSLGAPLTVAVPAVLAPQWRRLLDRLEVRGEVLTHERLSRGPPAAPLRHTADAARPLLVVDEAHRFREPDTRRYRALARLAVWRRVLLVTATPVHNRPADLLHLLRLFLRDDALVGFGLPSLAGAARRGGAAPAPVALPALARLVVARSRGRVVADAGLRFPVRGASTALRVAPVAAPQVAPILGELRRLELPAGAAPLLRLMLLRQFASSVAALRHSLRRCEAFCAVALEAALIHRRLGAREFRRLFPPTDDGHLQLAFLPLLLDDAPPGDGGHGDLAALHDLLSRLGPGEDPKADALERLLLDRSARTIVFAASAATVHHLRRRLMGKLRVGSVAGRAGWLGGDRVPRQEVIAAFAPRAQRVAPPVAACAVDVLIATDLLSEGLDLQDAERVIHYDLPWSPARMAQRVGRIDRLASAHRRIETIAFVPPAALDEALDLERRLARKVIAQVGAGAAQIERLSGPDAAAAPLDWCDRLQRLAGGAEAVAAPGAAAAVNAGSNAGVLVLRLGGDVEAVVVEGGGAAADPVRATELLELAMRAPPCPLDRVAVSSAVQAAVPLVRDRLKALATARWRAADRDQVGRRLVPLALAAARRAARAGRQDRLARLDALISRLTGGQTAGESLLLESIVTQRAPLGVEDLLAWHDGLPPLTRAPDAPLPALAAAVFLVGKPFS